jgi:hypothetical protein
MANERIYYCFCADGCKFETLTKEQIIAAIAEATGNIVTDVDGAFITMLKEQNAGAAIKLWVGTQAQYNALVASGNRDAQTIYCKNDGGVITVISGATSTVINEDSTNDEIPTAKAVYSLFNSIVNGDEVLY